MTTTIARNPDRLDAEEAASLLGLDSLDSLYRAVRSNRVPHFRIGRHVRFSKAALEAFMAAGGTSTAA